MMVREGGRGTDQRERVSQEAVQNQSWELDSCIIS